MIVVTDINDNQDQCTWKSDLPTLLSVCLISMEPDTVLRVMHEQFTPDERFGGNAATCTLSTPKDATATHILVFPTSDTAQVTRSSSSSPSLSSLLLLLHQSFAVCCASGFQRPPDRGQWGERLGAWRRFWRYGEIQQCWEISPLIFKGFESHWKDF